MQEAEDRKLDANDKKKKKEEEMKKKEMDNSDFTVTTSNTAERIFSLLMGEIVETLRKADKDDKSLFFGH